MPLEFLELTFDRLIGFPFLASWVQLVHLGIEILGLIPGRISISVDPRLAYNYDGIIRKVCLSPLHPSYATRN